MATFREAETRPHAAATMTNGYTDDRSKYLDSLTVRAPEDGQRARLATGPPVDNQNISLKAAPRGVVNGFGDKVLYETLQHFNHERIPERVVHARGAGAHGVFKLNKDCSKWTSAKVLTDTSAETPCFVRFSTVLGSRGSADTVRDTRGFAVKFYTQEGNWDIVGNNIPIFFVQDGINFMNLVHAGKPEPDKEMPQAQTAHNNFWDFISLRSETTHHAMWALSPRGIPRSYRMMEGFGVNSFILVNSQDERFFVKFHWKPHLGTHSLVWDEALKICGQDPDFHRRDLYDSIDAGAFPKWDLGLQIVPFADEDKFDFDLLDCTKLIPEELVPVERVGTLTLNRRPTDYFAETEQVAFCTSNLVHGIESSLDPMLQIRNQSYQDTQLSRLGGPNFNQIPINKPIGCPFITTQRDGYHTSQIPAHPNYWPNRWGLTRDAAEEERPITYTPEYRDGVQARVLGPKFSDSISQAQLFYNSLSDFEKEQTVKAASFEIGRCDDRVVREAMLQRFANIDVAFANEIAQNFDIPVPEPVFKNHGKRSPALSQYADDSPNVFTAAGKKVGIFAFDGYDGLQVKALQQSLTAAGIIPQIIGSRIGFAYPAGVEPGNNKAASVLTTNFTQETCRSTFFDALFFPNGNETYVKALQQGRVIHFAREAFGHLKTVSAAGSAVNWLEKKALPGYIPVSDGSQSFVSHAGVILAPRATGSEMGTFEKITGIKQAASFGQAFWTALAANRHPGRDISELAF